MFVTILALIGGISLFTYIVPWFIQAFLFKEQNLKKKYDAQWGLFFSLHSNLIAFKKNCFCSFFFFFKLN